MQVSFHAFLDSSAIGDACWASRNGRCTPKQRATGTDRTRSWVTQRRPEPGMYKSRAPGSFVRWRLTFVSPQYGNCFTPPSGAWNSDMVPKLSENTFAPGLNCLEKKHYRQFAYKRHTETRSRNHCSRGIAIILHIPSVSIALVTQHVNCMRHVL
jgi:hypothetical protein